MIRENSDRIIKHLIETYPDNVTYKLLKAERLAAAAKTRRFTRIFKARFFLNILTMINFCF